MSTWAKIKFYHDSILEKSGITITATSTESSGDYDVDYLTNSLEVNSWKAANAIDPMYISVDLGDVVINGDFETGTLTPWISWVNGSAAATFVASAAAPYVGTYKALITITNGGTGFTGVHLAQHDFTVRKGETWKLSFAGKVDSGRDIEVHLVDHRSLIDLTAEGGQIFSLTTSYVIYSTVFTITSDADLARFDFRLGGIISVVDLDEIKLERVSDADYLAILGHNLHSIESNVGLEYSDDGSAYSTATGQRYPSSDKVYLKEFTATGSGHRWWRVKIYGQTQSAPCVSIVKFGLKTELDYASASFDPNTQERKANVNISYGGYVTGIHEQYTERRMSLKFSEADALLYTRVNTWWEDNGLKNFFVAWDMANNPTEVFLMRSGSNFNNPLSNGGAQRDINISLIGRKE